EREPRLLRRAYARTTARLMIEFEKRALREFDAHVVVSEKDAAHLRHTSPDARTFVIENGVDTAYYFWSDSKGSNRNRVVFVGSMHYHANTDAGLEFARAV